MGMFDAVRYFRDRAVAYAEAGAKNVGEGWVGLNCPFCDDRSNHLGFNLERGYFSCWKCGRHTVEDVVMALERVEYHVACSIAMDYEGGYEHRPPPKARPQGCPATLEWPAGTVRMMPWHREYLAGRGFDPEFLEWKYFLVGTLDCGPYANRILAPVVYQGRAVSYQGRDITGRSGQKYKACRKDDEVVHHKHVLYNLDNCHGGTLVVVEGITDAWRLGDQSAATFGTTVTPQQVGLLARLGLGRLFTVFDPEPDAQRRARHLRDQVAPLGVEAANVRLEGGDPGGLPQDEADAMMRELLK